MPQLKKSKADTDVARALSINDEKYNASLVVRAVVLPQPLCVFVFPTFLVVAESIVVKTQLLLLIPTNSSAPLNGTLCISILACAVATSSIHYFQTTQF